jgi:hypothetical protein
VAPCPSCGRDHPQGECPRGADFGDWKEIQEVPSLVQAKLMALLLEESGIEARILDQTFHQEPLPSVRAFSLVKLLVRREQAEEARRLLSEPREPLDFSDEAEPGGGG